MIRARLPGLFSRLHRHTFSTSSLSRLSESALAETNDIATVGQLLKVVREFLLIFLEFLKLNLTLGERADPTYHKYVASSTTRIVSLTRLI